MDRYIVELPESIELNYEVAGIGSRFMATAIDTIVLAVIQLVLLFLLVFLGFTLDLNDALQSAGLAIYSFLSFLFFWGYYLLFELFWNGQSPGKRALGLRVVREGGRPLTFVAAAIRNLVRVVDFLPSMYGVGVLTMFIDQRSRRLGDMAAGTLVVKERSVTTLAGLSADSSQVALPPRPNDAPAPPLLPGIERLSAADYEFVQDFLRRRAELSRDARAYLANQLADGLGARLDLPRTGSAELFLENLARDYRLAQRARTP